MNSDNDILIFCLIGFLFLVIPVILADHFEKNLDYDKMGEMICSEKGNYEFEEFDSYTNTVICKKVNIEKYDGGYIKIEGWFYD